MHMIRSDFFPTQVDRSSLWNRNGTDTENTGNLDKPTGSVTENDWKPTEICGSLPPDSGRATRGIFHRLLAAHFSWNRLDFLDFLRADFGRIISQNFPVNSDDSRALEPAWLLQLSLAGMQPVDHWKVPVIKIKFLFIIIVTQR